MPDKIVVAILLMLAMFTQPVIGQEFKVPAAKPPPIHEVSIARKHQFELKADYYPGEPKAAGFILLHDCDSDRNANQAISELLAAQDYHVLSLDLRGFGRSTSDIYSHQKMKSKAKDIVSYQQQLALMTSYWEDDVRAAYLFLREKLDKFSGISLVSAGCSTPYAVSTAEQLHISNMVIITPNMNYADKERYKNLNDIATFFVSSVHNIASYQTNKELFEWNGHNRSRFLLFKGNETGAGLLKNNKSLAGDIASWLAERAD